MIMIMMLTIMMVTIIMMTMTRVAAWNSEDLPIYEPGLAEVVQEASLSVLKMSQLQTS